MPSSTSSSEHAALTRPTAPAAPPPPRPDLEQEPAYERPLPAVRFGLAAAVALATFALALGAWELHWRAFGATPAYVNSDGLWARERRRASAAPPGGTVFIGSSRTLSNVQLAVWERLDGRRPIQLALEGTSPMPALEQLAADPAFVRQRLVVGVTPGLFFSGFAYRGRVIERAPRETPSQRGGQWLSMRMVEPYFSFVDPDFALFRVLERQPWPQRAGAEWRPSPRKLFVGGADRNARLWAKVERDTAYRGLVQRTWAQNFRPLAAMPAPAQRERLARRAAQIDRAAAAVATLRARGVEVVFVRHPSAGPFLDYERATDPRAETWDVLLARTGARGIHCEDHPELQGYSLPEWSHMTGADADRYTAALYRIVAGGGVR